MNICICDADKKDRMAIEKICRAHFQKMILPYEMWEAESAREVLDRKEEINLLILGVKLPEMDGITLKNKLQKMGSNITIIFVTRYDEMMSEAFGKHVIAFIEKDLLDIKLPRCLDLAISLLGMNVMIAGNCNSRNIVKIHSEREYCNLYMKDGSTKLIRSSLTSLEKELSEANFVRISRSWLVNLHFAEEVRKREVVICGEAHLISRGYSKAVECAYDRFCERNAEYC